MAMRIANLIGAIIRKGLVAQREIQMEIQTIPVSINASRMLMGYFKSWPIQQINATLARQAKAGIMEIGGNDLFKNGVGM